MSMNLSVQQRAAANAPTAFAAEPAAERGNSPASSPFAGLLGERQRFVAGHGQNGQNAFAAPPAPAKANPPESRAEAARRPEPQRRPAGDEAKPIEKDNTAAKRAAAKDGVAPPAAKQPGKPVDDARRTADEASDEGLPADEADTGLVEPAGEPVDEASASDAADAAVAAQPAPAAPDPKVMLDWLARWGTVAPSRAAGHATTPPADADPAAESVVPSAMAGASAAGDLRPPGPGVAEADGGRPLAGNDARRAAAVEPAVGATEPSATQALHAAHADAQAEAKAGARAVAAEALLQPVPAGAALAAGSRELAMAALTAAEPVRGAPASERARVGELLSPVSPLGGLAMPTAPAATLLTGAPLSLSVATPVQSPDFSQALASQLTTLARGGVHEAELRLNPADMGPIAVQIVIDGAQAQIDFTASHAGTRQALETSLPALAAALNGAGLTLSGGGVFEQRSGGREGAADGERRAGGRSETIALGGIEGPAGARPPAARGLLDLYA
ncbi:flagellar hook-length control protein FliK [Methylibium petroleiphilum]|uniref:flagellar hook-length control protein FliK n=1 Tax=Methylibium petroleiphilum TaxID=105560 RepID=UPI002356F5C2|nr:flagellar hook-length control protein FliK [Methylibium petroleiphilum]